MIEYEYGIQMYGYDEPHRRGMTIDEATEWLQEWLEDGGREGVFRIIRRPTGDWERI